MVYIQGNSELTACNSHWLCSYYDDHPSNTYVLDNGENCTTTEEFSLLCDPSLSLHEHDRELLRIYPNPANNKIYIDYPGEIEYVRVISISGQELVRTGVSNRLEGIDISELARGMYVLELSNGIRNTFIKE